MPIEDIIHPFLKHYTTAPQWVKSTLGGAYARIPASLRYGAKYGEFMEEIKRSADEPWLRQRADEKLLGTLRWAAETVPAFSSLAATAKRDRSPDELLAEFPLLPKENIKADTSSFISRAMGPKTHLLTHTGGSTSVPMKLYLEKYVSRSKDFAYNGTFDVFSGIQPGDIILALRGRTVPGADRPGGPIWMFDPIKSYLHLSSDHLEPEHMPRYVEAARQWKPTFIHAFPSALVPLAKWLKAHPAPDVTDRIRCVQLFSENIYAYQVDLIREVFDCPVMLDYGHSERAVKAISTLNDPRYFFWPLYGKVELIDFNGRPVIEPGVLGEIVGTGFDNKVMPLIRYRTGDLAMWSGEPNHTRPGFPVVDRIEGRLQEFLVCGDHRLISICTIGAAHFEELASADMMQFEQTSPGQAVLKVMSKTDLSPRAKAALATGISAKTQGGLTIEVVRVDEISRTVSGKHKLLVQKLDLSRYLGAAHLDHE
jgi:phenylacetate-CoA ligase